MISIKNILTISKYEAKVLWRNWFFRIVALMGVGFLTIFNIGVFSEAGSPRWYVLSNSWLMPYACMVLISVPQAAAVIFLATGLIKKDKKLDTNEVFFVRPISNLDYVFGKALALFKLFFSLNVVLLCIPLITNLTSPFATFNPAAFIIYPLLTSVPGIIFTTGAAFLLVTILKNQPISIILLLGIAGVQVIYYFDQFSNILDFSAFRLSLLASDMTGFVDIETALWQRAFYLIAGIAFLFATAFFLDRLPGHKLVRMGTGLIGVALLVLSSFVMIKLWDIRQDPVSLRQEMIVVNGKWAELPNIDIVSNSIDFELIGDAISCTSDMVVKNNSDQTLPKAYFTLNPGLKVDQVLINGRSVDFTRNLQIVSIDRGLSISPGQEMKIKIKYQGKIWESVAHLEVAQERYESANDYFMFSLQKKYAFLQPDYVLLTKDVLWYPDTQIGYSLNSTTKERSFFIDFQLKVKTTGGQIPISQGEQIINGNTYHFKPEYALPQISLVIGKYEKKEITVDRITYAVYHYPKNDYFIKHLDQLADTLSYLITDIANEYEDAQKLSYPFKRLQFVETPVQFTAYNKIYESHQTFLQPETVFWPEEGGDIRQFDLNRQLRDMDRQARKDNQELSDKEKQANVFNDLVKRVFTKQIESRRYFDGRDKDEPDYSLFPNFYAYNSGIVSNDWALLNRSIATYLNNDKRPQNDYSRNRNGISFTEECNNLMRESSITKILTEETDFNKIHKSVSLKGQYLFTYLGQLVGEEAFKAYLYNWVNTHNHQLSSYAEFRRGILTHFNLDIDLILKKVYFDTAQAAFEILNVQKYEVLDGDRKRYQVLMDVKNSGENDGVIEVKVNTSDNSNNGRRNRRRRFNQEVEEEIPGRLSVIKQGETKQLGIVLDEKPNEITINTLISRNIPSEINMSLGTLKKRKGGALFDGERIVENHKASEQYEVIVDNEDPGFTTFSPIQPTYLRAFLDSRNPSDKKYYGKWFRSYSKWLPTTGSDFYGSTIRSAHFTRAGSGEKTTTWAPELTEEGFYDIYVYMRGKNQNQFRGNGGDNRQFNYHYIINHADGRDDIKYNISNAEPGWNYLGSYYFNQTGGNVMLTDECEFRTVYADAVKWVKQ
ncbi:hypothetical protein [Xanthovirga aplysinae]|uniref:golvesin C-terminal-like domain-containing protein n=1 Tax=Xanthovirga aplysinae TaxID=2529853 RepID=UPI0012BC666B|nr:hypothetical protein [Xanthovirga aplysinae]MTI33198.1 hypothetical protein [Xanthovirga aplysinae]